MILYIISLLPITFLYALANFVFFLSYHLIGYRKAVVIQNISRSFPTKKYGEVNAITKKFYTCFTAYFAEIIKSLSVSKKVFEQNIQFDNIELIDRHINAGRNVIACMGHCGNWEMLNFMPQKTKHPIYAVFKPFRNEMINRLMIKIRSRFGMNLITNRAVARHIRSKKASAAVYLFLADQCPINTEEKYRFIFFNQQSYFFSGMEKLARSDRSAVIYLHITQISKGNYKIRCLPICSDARNMEEGKITQKYLELLTENIQEEPYSWLWTHKRWKR